MVSPPVLPVKLKIPWRSTVRPEPGAWRVSVTSLCSPRGRREVVFVNVLRVSPLQVRARSYRQADKSVWPRDRGVHRAGNRVATGNALGSRQASGAARPAGPPG